MSSIERLLLNPEGVAEIATARELYQSVLDMIEILRSLVSEDHFREKAVNKDLILGKKFQDHQARIMWKGDPFNARDRDNPTRGYWTDPASDIEGGKYPDGEKFLVISNDGTSTIKGFRRDRDLHRWDVYSYERDDFGNPKLISVRPSRDRCTSRIAEVKGLFTLQEHMIALREERTLNRIFQKIRSSEQTVHRPVQRKGKSQKRYFSQRRYRSRKKQVKGL